MTGLEQNDSSSVEEFSSFMQELRVQETRASTGVFVGRNLQDISEVKTSKLASLAARANEILWAQQWIGADIRLKGGLDAFEDPDTFPAQKADEAFEVEGSYAGIAVSQRQMPGHIMPTPRLSHRILLACNQVAGLTYGHVGIEQPVSLLSSNAYIERWEWLFVSPLYEL